jgi:hypothetical protein
MVADWSKKLSAVRSQVYGPTSQRALEEMCVEILHALATEPGEAEGWRDIPVTDETLDYVSKYGGRCRDCADNFGVCPGGLPCNYEERRAAIRRVLRAINYGMAHGYLPAAPTLEGSHHG